MSVSFFRFSRQTEKKFRDRVEKSKKQWYSMHELVDISYQITKSIVEQKQK